VIGKGLALQFKRKWPANAKAYEAACEREEVVPGKMFVFDNGGLVEPKFIIHGWSERKRQIMKPTHVRAAYDPLVVEKWIEAAWEPLKSS